MPLPTDSGARAASSVDPARCPLCGQANRCAQSDPATRKLPCWCFSTPVSPGTLARLPEEARDKACLCPNCATLDEPG
ncbi:cysteine-rich CWC family protein [Pseudomonas kuykendallii]|uniref:Cysteine-rich CWC n=1 Tax=Pseudomonas kuykendallii TaxID=1007099 RepID=A0A1H3C1Q4_9PSED|nr:cysteine-rich CWC family protein [Pseudomonas kuykendallii]MCQ4269707.1 cysteine-rich CWC family protein [Pseudomonas kuykendallii]SDX47995.1 Cysteine-rich CWC [Pseudomonas kuykendallii]